ncbi:MAG: alpha-galactosidase [bacterium]|nr:alpha-galactosidase [bacterium]
MKTVIIGAGSAFGRRLSIDILSRPPLSGTEIGLCDIDPERLEVVRAFVDAAIAHNKAPGRVTASTERRDLLAGADFVVIAVSIGGPAYYDKPYEDEMGIPIKYGINQTIGDTVGPGGIMRALRTAPALREMVRDINELCPGALIINYTNPMAMLTWVLNEWAEGPVIGLCHGVQGTSKELAHLIGAPYEETDHWVAGINHMAWFLRFTHNRQDAYPRLREAMADPAKYKTDPIRFEMMRHFGYFCTESSRHTAEYVPYFRGDGLGVADIKAFSERVRKNRQSWFEDMGVARSKANSLELIRSHEYASGIMEAMMTGEVMRFNGNVMNEGPGGLIDNLPPDCCVEVPCLTDAGGIHPCRVGSLPPQCAALCRTNVNVQELTVRAILDRDREAGFQAMLLDPLTSSTLSLSKAREMFEEMWAAETHLLGYYEKSCPSS